MSDATSTLAFLLQLLARASSALADALATAEATVALMRDLGLAVDVAPQSLLNLQQPLQQLAAKETALEAALAANSEDSQAVLGAVADLALASVPFFQAVLALPSALQAEFAGDAARLAAIDGTFGRRLFDALAITFLADEYPAVNTALSLLGIVDTAFVPGDDPETSDEVIIPAHVARTIHFDRIKALVNAPQNVMQTVYGWGTPQFAFNDVLRALAYLCTSVGVRAAVYTPDATSGASATAAGAAAGSATPNELRATLILVALDVGNLELGLAIAPADSTTAAGTDRGILIRPYFSGTAGAQVPLTDALTLDLSGDFTTSTGIAVALRPPPGGFKILTGFIGGTGSTSVHVTVALAIAPASRIGIITQADLFTLDAAGLTLSIKFDAGATFGVGIGAALTGGKFAVQTGDADGFLQQVLPAGGLTVPFEIGANWSTTGGLSFTGSGALEITLPLHVTILDVLTLDSLDLAAGLKTTGGLFTSARLDASLEIGPVSASVQGIGAEVDLTFPGTGGNLGPGNAALTFLPPTGLGVAVDAGPVSGGGFVGYDPDHKRYFGVVQLDIFTVSLAAVGILDTELPGGQEGYSFVIIVIVGFPAIQLGYGFTLNKVGGIAGINRTIVPSAIQAAVRAHTIDDDLFPSDPVAHAPQIISDLEAIFPPAQGRYVFGPIAEIGWGEPTIITLEIGVIIEVPPPIIIVIPGELSAEVPDDDPAVELHVDIVGIIDFGSKLFSIDGSIHDSQIGPFALSGDLALRLSWADSPTFALSVGGLNPHFQPPPGFPTLQRLSVALSTGDNPRISLQTYFAVTSNSFQIGAQAELYVDVGMFNVYGWLGFDALITFPPFAFRIDFSAGLALRKGTSTIVGISVDGTLSGTRPWHVTAHAHVSLLFVSVTVNLDKTLGEAAIEQLASTNVWTLLLAAIGNPANWSAILPLGAPPVVTLAPPEGTSAPVLVEASGVVTMRQKVLPLNLPLAQFGAASLEGQSQFSIDAAAGVKIGQQTAAIAFVQDEFAPGQYQKLTDAEKLSRASFEPMTAGFSLASSSVETGTTFARPVSYDTIYATSAPTTPTLTYVLGTAAQRGYSRIGPASQAQLRNAGLAKYNPDVGTPILATVEQQLFVIAGTDDLVKRGDIMAPSGQATAYGTLASYLATHPAERDRLHVIPASEAA